MLNKAQCSDIELVAQNQATVQKFQKGNGAISGIITELAMFSLYSFQYKLSLMIKVDKC